MNFIPLKWSSNLSTVTCAAWSAHFLAFDLTSFAYICGCEHSTCNDSFFCPAGAQLQMNEVKQLFFQQVSACEGGHTRIANSPRWCLLRGNSWSNMPWRWQHTLELKCFHCCSFVDPFVIAKVALAMSKVGKVGAFDVLPPSQTYTSRWNIISDTYSK